LYLAVDISIKVDFVAKVVFNDGVFGEKFKFHSKIFVACHWCIQVEILDVNGHEFCIRHGDDAVEE
jgi:hypothetical protein